MNAELEEVALLLSIPVEDLRCALLYRNVSVNPSSTLNVDQFHCTVNSRDSTMSRTSPSRAYSAHPRSSFLSNSTSMCGRGDFASSSTSSDKIVSEMNQI